MWDNSVGKLTRHSYHTCPIQANKSTTCTKEVQQNAIGNTHEFIVELYRNCLTIQPIYKVKFPVWGEVLHTYRYWKDVLDLQKLFYDY